MANAYQRQARREINQAYRPAERSLSRQDRRVRAMDRKQARDESAFKSWVSDQQRALNAQAEARDQQLASVQSQYSQQARDAMGQVNADAAARAAQVGGGGVFGTAQGAPHDPVSSNPEVRAGTNYGLGIDAQAGARLAETQRLGVGLTRAVQGNSAAIIADRSSKRRLATIDAISKIADARGDLGMKKAAARAARAAELQQAAVEAARQAAKDRYDRWLDQQRLSQADARIDISRQSAESNAAARSESARQGRVRNQLARRRLAAGGKAGGPNPKDVRATRSALEQAISYASGTRATNKGDTRPVQIGPGHGGSRANQVRSWLETIGYTPALAEAAVWYTVYPGKKLPRRIARRLSRTTPGAIRGR